MYNTEHMQLVCSNKIRPRVQYGAKSHAGWDRDVYHAAKSGTATYCGIDRSEWYGLDPRPFSDVMADPYFCARCRSTIIHNRREAT